MQCLPALVKYYKEGCYIASFLRYNYLVDVDEFVSRTPNAQESCKFP